MTDRKWMMKATVKANSSQFTEFTAHLNLSDKCDNDYILRIWYQVQYESTKKVRNHNKKVLIDRIR